MHSRQNEPSAFWFDTSGLSFKPVNDVGPMIEYHAIDVVVRALVVWLTTSLIGGIALAAKISFVARVFHVPEFAEHQPMGFLMAGVLGVGVATWFMVQSLRQSHFHN